MFIINTQSIELFYIAVAMSKKKASKKNLAESKLKMKKMTRDLKMRILCGMVAYLAVASIATIQDDEQECAEQLGNLAACIPFVSGTANKPTPECCQDTQKVKANKPKCLCVLIKESTDPSMGLPVNTTLALQMPSACNIDAKVSDCPTILNLPPDSPDAKIFREAGSSDSTTTTTDSPPTAASSGSSSSPPSTPDSNSKTTPSSNGAAKTKLFVDCIIMALAFAALVLI